MLQVLKKSNPVNLLQKLSKHYLTYTAQLFMEYVHQNSHHYVHTEGFVCVLPYGAVECRVHLHVYFCFLYAYESI